MGAGGTYGTWAGAACGIGAPQDAQKIRFSAASFPHCGQRLIPLAAGKPGCGAGCAAGLAASIGFPQSGQNAAVSESFLPQFEQYIPDSPFE
jgi:hypothetical protein